MCACLCVYKKNGPSPTELAVEDQYGKKKKESFSMIYSCLLYVVLAT